MAKYVHYWIEVPKPFSGDLMADLKAIYGNKMDPSNTHVYEYPSDDPGTIPLGFRTLQRINTSLLPPYVTLQAEVEVQGNKKTWHKEQTLANALKHDSGNTGVFRSRHKVGEDDFFFREVT